MARARLLALLSLSYAVALLARPDDFPGWLGEKRSRSVEKDEAVPFTIDPTKVINLSWKPRAFLYKGFLTEEECDHLIELAKDGLQKSAVVDHDSGKPILSTVRTSSGMFIDRDKDEVVSRIEDKIAIWTFLGKENGERMQVLKYQKGEKYEPHYDYFRDKVNQGQGGHRVATVLMYLSNVAQGGETVFPDAKRGRRFSMDETFSDCAKRGVSVKPRKGDALLFFSLSTEAIPDPSSLHGGCPVIEGEKWSATKWIHVQSLDSPARDVGDCKDEDESCGEWAAYGECQKNPTYMIGTSEQPGYCRRSCRVC
ncbi:hypothetical protein GOP47_0027412 [Adiantum capillus-veneris]|nr:hypothetical protein GOP47_0027412 [Adiantum capillus-veneris]